MNFKANHKLASLAIAVVFGLSLALNHDPNRRLVLAAIQILGAALYNIWHVRRSDISLYWSAFRFGLFECALVVALVLSPAGLSWPLLAVSGVLIYFVELGLTVVSEQMLFLETLITAFGLLFGAYAVWFYFAPGSTITLAAVFLITLVVCRGSFDFIPRAGSEKAFYSLIIAACLTEISWALILLPLHYSALAVASFDAFYVLWILAYFRLYNNLNPKKIAFHLSFSAILILAILASTPWK